MFSIVDSSARPSSSFVPEVTIGEALRDAAVRLERIGGTGRLDAAFLLAHAGGVTRQEMLAHASRPLEPDVAERFVALVAKREAGMPLAYVTGEAGFYGRMFAVDERVLVPRPETEIAVEWAVRHLRAIGRERGRAADVGTGSGAIAVSLACELPDLDVFAADSSADALAVARSNAARNNVFQHITFLQGDLAAPLLRYAPFDCVVANLPYVPSAECAPAAATASRCIAASSRRCASSSRRAASRSWKPRPRMPVRSKRSCGRRYRRPAARSCATTRIRIASSSRPSRPKG
jgi:HemK-like putative methylase